LGSRGERISFNDLCPLFWGILCGDAAVVKLIACVCMGTQ